MPDPIYVEIEALPSNYTADAKKDESYASGTVTIKLWGDDHKGTVVMTYTAVSDGPAADPTVTPTQHTVLLDPDDTASNPVRRYVQIQGDAHTGVFTVEAVGNGASDSDSGAYSL